MRNLKRALSLTLASVMLLGMMVIGTSAAAGYSDVDADDNVEAIEVLQAIEVMVGDDRGFGPDRPVNRAEMAVVMGLLLNLDYNYYVSTCPFADVSGNYEWARGWVGACAANGIVSGRGEGIYDPAATVTAIEAASMMMRALGYFQNAEDYNDGFVLVTVRQGNQIGLFNGVGSDGSTPMTRNQVAQMALNALRSEMVDFTGTPGIEVNGVKVGYRAEYTPRTSTEAKYNAIEGRTSDVASDANHKGQYYIQLGEQLYDGDLRLNNSDLDCFQRPSRTWEYKGEQIGTYMKKELLRQEYTEKVTGKMLYDLLSKNTIETYDFVIAIDGETDKKVLAPEGGSDYGYFTEGNLVRTNTETVGKTGNGVLTQVFVDNNSEDPTVYIAIINTYLAKADDDYNERKDEASFTIWSVDYKNKALVKDTSEHTVSRNVKGEDFDIEDVKDGDIVLVRVAENEIKEIIVPEILPDLTINSFSKKDWINVGGTKYDYANSAQYDTDALYQYSNSNLKELTYNVVLDMYGYLIGIEQNEEPDQYVFITGNDGGASDLRNGEADMAAIFLDGTMKVIKVNMKDSTGVDAGAIVNTWCTYSVNSKDVYTLEAVSTSYNEDHGQWAQNVEDAAVVSAYANAGSTATNWTYTIDKGHVSLVASSDGVKSDKRVYGNDKTVYINVDTSVIACKSDYGQQSTKTGNGYSNVQSTPAADLKKYYMTNSTAVNKAIIIDDVESVTVGVKNTNIVVDDVIAGDYNDSTNTPYTDAQVAVPKSEIYTLYEGGDVIAVITIGEDQGTTSKYVYVHTDDVEWEEYGHGTSEKWRWEREVLMDGKITSLYEVTDSNYSKIDTAHMDQGCWYKISFDADGNVRKVDGHTAWASNYATNVEDVETYYDANKKTTIIDVDYRTTHLAGGLRFVDGTLYTDYNNRKGFSVATDVNVVYANAKLKSGVKAPTGNFADVTWFDETIVKGSNYRALESALKLIDSRDADIGFCGVLAAVIEDGVATTIIINDTYGEYIDQGGSTETVIGKYSSVVDQEITTGLSNLDMSDKTGTNISFAAGTDGAGNPVTELTLNVYGGGDIATQIKDALTIQGYTIVGKIKKAGNTYTITAEKDGVEETITCNASSDANEYWIVDNNGTKSYVADSNTVTISAVAGSTGFQAQEADGTKTYYAYAAPHTVDQDVTLEPGYVKVTAATTGSTSVVNGLTPVGLALKDATLATSGVKAGGEIQYTYTFHGTEDGTGTTFTFTPGTNSTIKGTAPTVTTSSAYGTATAPTVWTITVTVGTADVAAATAGLS